MTIHWPEQLFWQDFSRLAVHVSCISTRKWVLLTFNFCSNPSCARLHCRIPSQRAYKSRPSVQSQVALRFFCRIACGCDVETSHSQTASSPCSTPCSAPDFAAFNARSRRM